MVLTCGAPVYLCGLDVTLASYLTAEELDELAKQGTKQAVFARDVLQGILQFSRGYNLPGVCFHDPVTLLYADDDSYFQTDHVGIRVETKGSITRGKTVTDLYSDKQMEHNAYIVTKVDREDQTPCVRNDGAQHGIKKQAALLYCKKRLFCVRRMDAVNYLSGR
jgi:inosine-uridine nucleoside N-ribohydrolase